MEDNKWWGKSANKKITDSRCEKTHILRRGPAGQLVRQWNESEKKEYW